MVELRSRWMQELTWDVIEQRLTRDDVVLVPIGATEQHGHHAPMLVDTGWAVETSADAAALADCLIAPPLHYGWSYGHMGFPGAIGLTAETLTRVAVEIGECLVHHGFGRIIFVNGNRVANLAPLEIAAVQLHLQTGAFTAVADCGMIARDEIAALSEGPAGALGHAGESETALALARYPHLTDMDRAPADRAAASDPAKPRAFYREVHSSIDPQLDGNGWFVPRNPQEFRTQTQARFGVVGDARLATAEKGEAMIAAIAKQIAAGVAVARSRTVTLRKPQVHA